MEELKVKVNKEEYSVEVKATEVDKTKLPILSWERLTSQDMVDDIKTFFDALRNIGIGSLFGIFAILGKETIHEYVDNEKLEFVIVCGLLTISVSLFFFNMLWAYKSTKDKGSKWLFIFALLVVFYYCSIMCCRAKSYICTRIIKIKP
jgi:hypothetical protein